MRKLAVLLALAAVVALVLALRDGTEGRAGHRSAATDPNPEPVPEKSSSSSGSTDGDRDLPDRKTALAPATGVIHDHDSEEDVPVEGARVELLRMPDWFAQRANRSTEVLRDPVAVTETDAQGRFTLRIPPGGWQLRYSAKGYLTNATDFFSDPDSEFEFELTMMRSRTEEVLVVDAKGRPLSGARILTYSIDTSIFPVSDVRTSTTGRAAVAAAGDLLILKPAFATRIVDETLLPRIVLRPARGCGGIVRDPEGKPLGGLEVVAASEEGTWSEQTNDLGRFRFEGLGLTGLEISVGHPGYPLIKRDAWPGEMDLELVFSRFATLAGRVLRPDGGPAIHAEVVFGESASRTAEDGRFKLGVAPGTGDLIATRLETFFHKRLTIGSGERIEDLELRLRPLYTSQIDVWVENAAGQPVEGAEVYVVREQVSYREMQYEGPHANTTAAGWARVQVRDPPGTELEFAVFWSELGRLHSARARGRTAVDPGASEVRVRFPPNPQFRIRVATEDGSPTADLRKARIQPGIGVWIIDREATQLRMGFNPDGGDFVVNLYVPGFERALLHRKEPFRPGEEVDLLLRRGARIAGRMKGAPLPPETEILLRKEGTEREWSAPIDKDGSFTLENLPPLRGQLILTQRPLLPEVVASVHVERGQTLNLGSLDLPARRDASLLVVDSRERPLGGTAVHVWRTQQDAAFLSAQTTTRRDGRTTAVVSKDPAETWIFVWKREHGSRLVLLEEPRGTQKIVLPRGGSVRLHVRHAIGAELPPLTIRHSNAPFDIDFEGERRVVSDGTVILFRDLPAGEVTFRLGFEGERTARATVVPGKTASARLTWDK